MPDYGHDLMFGVFITPSNQDAEGTVALAELSERSGLDLVTFQDHPYQPTFLDTWTLLSYVAARTSTVRLAANVHSLPLRPPAVLAKSAASLDILSGGRVELGLGAGAFWDAIAAMGGPRRTPGEAVGALDEAIRIIRQVWDVDAPGPVRVDGEHYRVVGAKRGPRPAHDMAIWLGAYQPRMLRLVGAAADGWLPSESYLPHPGALTSGNARIDEAAEAAGRSPADVRRLLNLGGDLSAARLADLALGEGISGFIVMADDPTMIQRLGAEIAPAVREIVEQERSAEAPAASTPVPRVLERQADDGPVASLGVTPTPDDGVRRGTGMPWDESTRPSAPAPPAGVTYTRQDEAQAQHLIDVHDQLRAELDNVRALVDQVRQGTIDAGRARSAINEMTMRQNDWTLGAYCSSYCRAVTQHHTLEDIAMLPRLRAKDAGLGPVLDRLTDEHKAIHGVLEEVDRALVDYVARPDDIEVVQRAVDLLTDALLSHLSYEERQLVEPLARHGL